MSKKMARGVFMENLMMTGKGRAECRQGSDGIIRHSFRACPGTSRQLAAKIPPGGGMGDRVVVGGSDGAVGKQRYAAVGAHRFHIALHGGRILHAFDHGEVA